jgi:hypothetical protein
LQNNRSFEDAKPACRPHIIGEPSDGKIAVHVPNFFVIRSFLQVSKNYLRRDCLKLERVKFKIVFYFQLENVVLLLLIDIVGKNVADILDNLSEGEFLNFKEGLQM